MTEYVGSRERAKQFRTLLKKSFPGVKFSVRCDTGTAWNWISVRWEDGPTGSEVGDLLRPLHSDLTIERKFSAATQQLAAEMLKAHHPEIEVFREDGSINWSTETYLTDIIIGRRHVRNQTMRTAIVSIAEHYVLGDEEQFPNAAEREREQRKFLSELDEKSKAQQAELEALESNNENLLQHEAGGGAQQAEEARGRLTRGNPFVLGMHAGEKAHLEVRKITPFEAVLTAVPDTQAVDAEDLTPREVTSLSPFGRPLTIFCVPALVMGDTDGYQAGETVWIGKTISTVLDDVERVLVSRGDGHPLQPVTTNFLLLV